MGWSGTAHGNENGWIRRESLAMESQRQARFRMDTRVTQGFGGSCFRTNRLSQPPHCWCLGLGHFFCYGGCSVHRRIFNSILDLSLLDASSPAHPQVMTIKSVSRYCWMSLAGRGERERCMAKSISVENHWMQRPVHVLNHKERNI